MATSRTGTAEWKKLRAKAIRAARKRGQTLCPYCKVELDYTNGRAPSGATVDHVNPYSYTQSNSGPLVVICSRCNSSKGANSAPKGFPHRGFRGDLGASREW